MQDEIERLQLEIHTVKQENKYLEEKKSRTDNSGKISVTTSSPDSKMLLILTKKLEDASSTYERVKKDMNALKRVRGTNNFQSTWTSHLCTLHF